MNTTFLFRLVPTAVIMMLVACSSGPQVNSTVLSAATSRGVAQTTESKMLKARTLDLDDIENLVSKGVPSQTIVAYLTSIRQSFRLSSEQLTKLQSDGAEQQLLAYLRESAGFYHSSAAPRAAKHPQEPAGQYTNSRGNQDEQPFAYNEPAVDGFYDSAYEESLYSPFSFN